MSEPRRIRDYNNLKGRRIGSKVGSLIVRIELCAVGLHARCAVPEY